LIVMSLSDKIASLPDLDPAHEQIVVLFNASDTTQSFMLADAKNQGFRLHPVQANSEDATVRAAAFNPATGQFDVPPRTTAVFVQGERTQITIVKDAQPDNKRNFHFEGDLGRFILKDWEGPQGGNFNRSQTFGVDPGAYMVRENVPNDWWLLDIVCDVAGRSQADLSKSQVRINVYPGDSLTCTFVNGAATAVLGRVYADRNADGMLNPREAGLQGWRVTVYTPAGQQVRTDKTNGNGKANFWNLLPGAYKVCSEFQANWWNTQPGATDPALGNQACYTVNGKPGRVYEAFFGYAEQPPSVRASSVAEGLRELPNPYLDNSDEGSSQPFEEPDAGSPLSVEPMFLPMITR
jgi:hypothetical protein